VHRNTKFGLISAKKGRIFCSSDELHNYMSRDEQKGKKKVTQLFWDGYYLPHLFELHKQRCTQKRYTLHESMGWEHWAAAAASIYKVQQQQRNKGRRRGRSKRHHY
jgi:hypothetical protein